MNNFIDKIKAFVLLDSLESNVLPSLTIAQAILESGWGRSGLTLKAYNLFGVKGSFYGKYIWFPTREFKAGKWVVENAKFRQYPSFLESIKDHSKVLLETMIPTNGGFTRRYQKVIGEKDYKNACKYVRDAGYATDPNYTNLLIDIIESNKLNLLDEEYFKMKEGKNMQLVEIPEWKKQGLEWLRDCKNISPPVDETWLATDSIDIGTLGTILSRLVRK